MARSSYLRRVAAAALSSGPALVPTRQAAPEEARPHVAAPVRAAAASTPTQAQVTAQRPRAAPPGTPATEAAALPVADVVTSLVPSTAGEPPDTDTIVSEPPPMPESSNGQYPAWPIPEATTPLPSAPPPSAGESRLAAAGSHVLVSAPRPPGPAPRAVPGPSPRAGFARRTLPPETAAIPPLADIAAAPGPSAAAGDPPPFVAATLAPVLMTPVREPVAAAPGQGPVEVRIGTIEIRAAAPALPAPIVPPAPPSMAPAARPPPAFPRSYTWRYGIAQG
jgi:hypothetical protein